MQDVHRIVDDTFDKGYNNHLYLVYIGYRASWPILIARLGMNKNHNELLGD